jgi:hypothetical protein
MSLEGLRPRGSAKGIPFGDDGKRDESLPKALLESCGVVYPMQGSGAAGLVFLNDETCGVIFSIGEPSFGDSFLMSPHELSWVDD